MTQDRYGSQFGRIAVELGFITETQLSDALRIRDEINASEAARLLPTVLFDQGWMTSGQIDQVLNRLFKDSRADQAQRPIADSGSAPERS